MGFTLLGWHIGANIALEADMP